MKDENDLNLLHFTLTFVIMITSKAAKPTVNGYLELFS